MLNSINIEQKKVYKKNFIQAYILPCPPQIPIMKYIGTKTSSAYIYEKPATGWGDISDEVATVSGESPSVSISDNYIFIGSGRIYEKSGTSWATPQLSTLLYTNVNVSYYGTSVANTDQDFFVGGPYYDYDFSTVVNSGCVLQYDNLFEPLELNITSTSIDECSMLGDTIGVFSTLDGNRFDKHVFEFSSDGGINDVDNNAFIIVSLNINNNK